MGSLRLSCDARASESCARRRSASSFLRYRRDRCGGRDSLSLPPAGDCLHGGRRGDALDLATVRDVLFETSVGRTWQVQAAAALILIAAVAVPSRCRKTAVTLASGFMLASVALTGHAVMGAGM